MRPRQLLNRGQAVCTVLAAASPLHFAQADDMVEFMRALYVQQVNMHASVNCMSDEAF